MDLKCPYCQTDMQDMGTMNFRVGGYSGGAGMLLGGWNQLAEKIQPFEVYRCSSCGKVDFFLPPERSRQPGREKARDGSSMDSTIDENTQEKKHHFFR